VVHSVGPSVVIAVRSKDVSIRGEIFQLSGFSVTPLQSRPVT
jgi:hypothetical protein